jgi:hypothetical protein
LAQHAADLDVPGLEVDHEQHKVANEPRQREHLNREEVRGGDRAQVRAKKGLPRQPPAARRCGLEAVPEEDALDGVAGEPVAVPLLPSPLHARRQASLPTCMAALVGQVRTR